MISTSRDAHKVYFDAGPPSVIPIRKTPWFMRMLWLLALLMLVGIVYSFWRISNVASPTLDVPPSSTDNARPN